MRLDCNRKLPDAVGMRVLWVITGVCLLAVTARAADLAECLDANGNLWKLSGEQFVAARRGDGFRWESAKRDVARATGETLRFAGLRVWEATARFDGGAARELTLSLYNRGDAGALDATAFEKLLAETRKALTDFCGAKGVPLKAQERTPTITVSREAWVKGAHRLDLVSSFTPSRNAGAITVPMRPEFVRLSVTKFDPANAPRAGFEAAATTARPTKILTILDFRARVKREANGDVWVSEVPMVDQGKKGYCAAAVMERVVRYFGREVDQHEVAQLANTSATGGTTTRGMIGALQRMAEELRLQLTPHVQFTMAEFEKLIADYNRCAHAARKEEIALNRREVIDLGEVYAQMDGAVLKQARLRREAGMTDFKNVVAKYVNTGCPLVWSVMMGKVTETPAVQGKGGHMRMIIGYNDRQKEILYSDTWGAGHERKRMSLADAWTITMDVYTVEPRNVRF